MVGHFEASEGCRVNGTIVGECIDGLLQADFFSGSKRRELIEMRNEPAILAEIGDVLNMDMDIIETWEWEKPVALHQRRMLNGKYRVHHDEEIHQAILLQFVGMKWAIFMKTKAFPRFFHSGAWTQAPYRAMDKAMKQRREYFLGTSSLGNVASVRTKRRSVYKNDFFLLQLPDAMTSDGQDYDNHDVEPSPAKHQKRDILHRIITTELHVQNAVHGQCTVLQSDFKWFGPSIPHDTILAVLRFLGVKGKWLDFFRKFLTMPCYWADESKDGTPEIKYRKRGIPTSHILSNAMGEAILFCMDFAVSKATGGADLYRLHDDLWFWGQEEMCVKAWKAMQDFTSVMGLELNMEKTGCVQVLSDPAKACETRAELPTGDIRFGLLKLDAKRIAWVVDEERTRELVKELGRQLRACNSVFAWVQACNSYACRFLSANLAQPANCFGLDHVNMLLKTFSRIQTQLFGPGGSAHKHLRKMIADPSRKLLDGALTAEDIPDAFFYFPLSMGGLELHNPFISPLAVRDRVPKEVNKVIRQAFESDEDDYEAARKKYERGEHITRQRVSSYVPKKGESFMSREEYARFREETLVHLAQAYKEMLEVPRMLQVDSTSVVQNAVTEGYKGWWNLPAYWKWMFELHRREGLSPFGGVSIEREMLPSAMVDSLRSGRTRWIS